ncbi:MAG: AAA family ATPase [Solirubrobacterales bacterium]
MRCPSCGNLNREGAHFCDSCGTRLARPAPAAGGPQPPEPAAGAPQPPASETGAPQPSEPAAAGPRVPPPPEGAPERLAGHLEVIGFLGRGAGKEVYLARDGSEGGAEVAVALFEVEGLGEAAMARVRREMQAMERLGEHSHVVPVIETGEEGRRPYIVSPYMRGGDVKQLAAQQGGRIPVERAVEIAIDVCRALEHAHGCGIVHRDLKPANVWLDGDGRACLGDFGLAATGPGRTGLVGTVAYLPPEQALGRPTSAGSDLYSLGAMLYEMVAGRPPFEGESAVSVIGQHLNAQAVPPSRHEDSVPAALDALILELLSKTPQERPASAAEVRARLEEVRDAPGPPAGQVDPGNPLEGLAGGVFVGREPELAELRAAADEALGGRGRLVLLSGEPGIGKTRTAEELATYARLRGANVHWGRCLEGEGAPPYWPWVQAIRSYAREADPVALAWEMGAGGREIGRIVPELAERFGTSGEQGGPEDEQSRFRLFDAISAFLGNAATSRPLAIALDDLHWADEPSLRLLEFLARGLSTAPLLLLGTYRDVELGRRHPLSRVLAELSSLERSRRVDLHGLGEVEIASYIERTTGIEAPPRLVAEIHRQTEGNPFFVGEVVRLLAGEGELDAPSSGRALIPQGVRDVVGRRLDGLSTGDNELLRTAAAIGRDFDLETLAAVTGSSQAGLREGLRRAAGAQFLVEAGAEGRYRFAHALVRETLYEELTPTGRPILHSRIAAALERIYAAEPGRTDRRLAELAYHFNEAAAAGEPAKAVDYGRRAGHRALGQLGYEEAAEHFARALEAADLAPVSDRERCLLLLDLGEARMRGGDQVRARETLERAARTAEVLGDPELLTRAAVGVAFTAEVGRFDEGLVELLERALEAVGGQDSPPRAILLSWLGAAHYWRDPQGRAADLHRESVEMARRLGDDGTLAHTLSRANFIDVTPEAARRGLESNAEVIALARKLGDRELELRSHVLRLSNHLALGDIPAVDRDLDAYARLASELRQPSYLWHVPLLRGMRAMIDGRFEEAEELAQEARSGGRLAGEPLAEQFFVVQALTIYRQQGRLAEIADAVAAMVARFPAVRAWGVAHASVLADLGRRDEALELFEELAADEFAGIPRDAQWPISQSLLCEAAFRLGERGAAAHLRSVLAPYRGLVVVAGRSAASRGPVARYLGLGAEAAGELAIAIRDYEDSIALSRRMGDRPFTAEASIDLARALMARGEPGDPGRAAELIDRSLDAAQRLRMPGTSERALALKLEAHGIAGIDAESTIDDVIGAVEQERPDVRSYAAPDGSVTILFSDIESSTAMTERLGDERWLAVLRDHNEVFRERLAAHGGYEVKNQGDGFMLVFPSPAGALRCAVEVQRAFEARAGERPDERIRVRIGLHTGEAIASEGDFFGRNVILAARIAAQARGGEILVSEALHDLCEDEEGAGFAEARRLELKGLAGTHTVYAAEWKQPAGVAR